MENDPPTTKPHGQLAIRMLAMPSDANPNGDVFGGWIVSHMDLAGLSVARKFSHSRVTTIAIDSMAFLNPVYIGDFICCYAELIKVGNASMKIRIETWATSTDENKPLRKVTEGLFTFVAINEHGRPIPADPAKR